MRMLRLLLTLVLACSLLSLASAPASAQGDEGAPATSRDAEARGLFEAGREAFTGGRYEAALEYFQRAYELSGRAALLYNIGSAADRLRRDREALDAYRGFIEAEPGSPQAAVARERITFLEAQLTAAEPEPEPVASEPAAGSSDVDRGEGGSVVEEWWFWTLIGTAVAAAVVIPVVVVATQSPGTEAPLTGDVGPGGVVVTLTGTF